MSRGGFTVFDGTHLRSIDHCFPESDAPITGDQVLDLAEKKASSAMSGFPLPENLRASALKLIGIEDVGGFRSTKFSAVHASDKLKNYIRAIEAELEDHPLIVSFLDGETVRWFIQDEDDFAMLAENVFTDLDKEDEGKIRRSEIRAAVLDMGVEMGVPPLSDFPKLDDIIKKHEGDGEDQLGQAQFAKLLQSVLEELETALSATPVFAIRNMKILNGSKIKKLLVYENQLSDLVEKMLSENQGGAAEIIKSFLEKSGLEIGVPPSEGHELLYDAVFADAGNESVTNMENNEFKGLVKVILQKFACKLEEMPVLYDLEVCE